MGEPRFYILEHSGYRAMSKGNTKQYTPIEVLVLDRDYNHAVAWHKFTMSDAALIRARGEAARIVIRLHEQDAEELAA